LTRADSAAIEALYRELEDSAAAVVREAAPDGAIRFERIADMSYHGQGHQLRIVLADRFDPSDAERRFMAAYRDAYGYAYDDMEAQIVTLRVIASVSGDLAPVATAIEDRPAAPGRVRKAFDPVSASFVDHAVLAMDRLAPGQQIAGPAIVEDRGSTVRIGQGARARFRPEGWLHIEMPA
jgi:N-methylhydantoinase A/oxoprolinase/acetone carboxylase beta subunit